ncbi:unnamed protein product [Anisakis simplex]|uniref:DUF3475 domain-containing protein n=1 Tax=Anisakis simplex TaxID=6269 RepID=A0A0M3JRN3_ANISI|nr:unnamed protein product [Anisakis simplex]
MGELFFMPKSETKNLEKPDENLRRNLQAIGKTLNVTAAEALDSLRMMNDTIQAQLENKEPEWYILMMIANFSRALQKTAAIMGHVSEIRNRSYVCAKLDTLVHNAKIIHAIQKQAAMGKVFALEHQGLTHAFVRLDIPERSAKRKQSNCDGDDNDADPFN